MEKKNKNPLVDLFEIEVKQLELEFQKASNQGKGTSQEVADFRENYFNTFLSRYFPYPHRISKGKIIDSYGYKSDSIDSIIISPLHPYTIDSKEKFSLILADGVDLVIELKPDLSRKYELERGLKQIQSVKKLSRVKTPMLSPRIHGHSKARIEQSLKIPTFIFTLKAPKNIKKFIENIINFYKSNNIPTEEQFDFLIIKDIGVILNLTPLHEKQYPDKKGFILEYTKYALLRLLYYMNIVDSASMNIQTPILLHYFKNLKIDGKEHFYYDEDN